VFYRSICGFDVEFSSTIFKLRWLYYLRFY